MNLKLLRYFALISLSIALAFFLIAIPANLVRLANKDKREIFHDDSVPTINIQAEEKSYFDVALPDGLSPENLRVGLYDTSNNKDFGESSQIYDLFVNDNPSFTNLELEDGAIALKGPTLSDHKIRYWIISSKGVASVTEFTIPKNNKLLTERLNSVAVSSNDSWNVGEAFYLEYLNAKKQKINLFKTRIFSPKAANLASTLLLPKIPIYFEVLSSTNYSNTAILRGNIKYPLQAQQLYLVLGTAITKDYSPRISLRRLKAFNLAVSKIYKLQLTPTNASALAPSNFSTNSYLSNSSSFSSIIKGSVATSNSSSNSSPANSLSSSLSSSSKTSVSSTTSSWSSSSSRYSSLSYSSSSSTSSSSSSNTSTSSSSHSSLSSSRTSSSKSSSSSSSSSSFSTSSSTSSSLSSNSSSSSSSSCGSNDYGLSVDSSTECTEGQPCEVGVSVYASKCVEIGGVDVSSIAINNPFVAESGPALTWKEVYNEETGLLTKLTSKLVEGDAPPAPDNELLDCDNIPAPPSPVFSQLWHGQRLDDPTEKYCHYHQNQSQYVTTVMASFTINLGNGQTSSASTSAENTLTVRLPGDTGSVVWNFNIYFGQITDANQNFCCVAADPPAFSCDVDTLAQLGGYKSQYSAKVMAEECFHERQLKGSVGVAEGGMDVASLCSQIKAELARRNNLQTCKPVENGNIVAACRAARTEFRQEVQQFRGDINTARARGDDANNPNGFYCWREKTAKIAVGFTTDNGGYNLECSHDECDPNQTQPPPMTLNFSR